MKIIFCKYWIHWIDNNELILSKLIDKEKQKVQKVQNSDNPRHKICYLRKYSCNGILPLYEAIVINDGESKFVNIYF